MKKFKACAQHVFSIYQPSMLGTIKFPIFEHLFEDLGELRHIDYLHAGHYEATHKELYEIHRSTSKHHGPAMRNVLKKHGFQANDGIPRSNINKEKVEPKNNASKCKAVIQKAAFLVQNVPFRFAAGA